MISLFEQIKADIKKYKSDGLSDLEIALLPELNVSVSDNDILNLILNSSKINSSKISFEQKQEIKFIQQATNNGLSGQEAERYVQIQMNLWKKEQHEKAIKEAKLLGTAMQQLLPEIFEDKRAIPNCFLRGALFGMVRKGRRALVGNLPIFTMSQYDLTFTGYELDQNDLELWDILIYLAKKRNIENELRITLYDLCQQMKLTPNQERYKKLMERALRLKTGVVQIKNENKIFAGSLINNVYIDTIGDGKLVIEYNKKLTPLFTDGDYTLISADIRHLLGDNQLARWLYNFYESHNQPIPFSIDFIQKLCRSGTELKDFKRKLKNALEDVKKAHLAVNLKAKWNYELTNKNYLLIYPKGKAKKQLELLNKF